MALSSTKRMFPTQLTDFTDVVTHFTSHFQAKGYTVTSEDTAQGKFISLTKGGLFRTVSGMRTGLNITLTKNQGLVEVAMEVGIVGSQAIASAIAVLVAWPVVIPQIIGLVQQNKLDEEAYHVIEEGIRLAESGAIGSAQNPSAQNPSAQNYSGSSNSFCPHCGASIMEESVFCSKCGKEISQ